MGIPYFIDYRNQQTSKGQNAAAGYVLSRHANIQDVIKLSWLPITERIDYSTAVLAFKPLHERCPSNLQLILKEDRRNLRNNHINAGPKIDCHDQVQSFQSDAAYVFNALPKNIRG